eukprot:1554441-Lingulodinium_polyedra.AAC.1
MPALRPPGPEGFLASARELPGGPGPMVAGASLWLSVAEALCPCPAHSGGMGEAELLELFGQRAFSIQDRWSMGWMDN